MASQWDRAERLNPYRITGPGAALRDSLLFLVFAAFIPLVLYREVANAFMSNPGLNGLILLVLLLAITNAFAGLFRLMGTASWFNRFLASAPGAQLDPVPDSFVPLTKVLADRAKPPRYPRRGCRRPLI
jgi:hypothetical protein